MVHSRMTYSLLGGIAFVAQTPILAKGIAIESVSKFDGIFFTADTIEILRKYQRSMLTILNGKRLTNGSISKDPIIIKIALMDRVILRK